VSGDVRLAAAVLIAMLASGAALGQTRDSFTCGSFKAESWRDGQTTNWTVARGAEKATEKGVLRSPPRFECLGNAALTVEIAFAAGSATFAVYFPDGTDLTYGRQQVDRRGNRWVLPVQAKSHVPTALQAAFDYHCKMDMPLNPIPASARADCVK
jgi:hypothetical protein